MTRVVLTGDSHLGAIKRAHVPAADDYPWLSFATLGKGSGATSPFFEVDREAGLVRITSAEWNKLCFSRAGLEGEGSVDLLVLSLPVNTSRILRDHDWRTHVPWHLKLHDHEVALSDAFVDALIDWDSGHAVAFATELKSIGMTVAVLEAPRFFEDARYLQTSRMDVIRHVDQRYRHRVSQKLSAEGIDVIPQAPWTISELGTTKMEFDNERPNDMHHANALYGTIVLDQIRHFAADRLGLAVP